MALTLILENRVQKKTDAAPSSSSPSSSSHLLIETPPALAGVVKLRSLLRVI